MRIMILFPPSADPTRPYITLPMQQAYLRAMGYEDVSVYDANLEAFDWLTGEASLLEARSRVERMWDGSGRSGRASLAPVLACADYVIREIESAKRVVRERPGRSTAEVLHAWLVFKRAVQLASAPYHPGGFGPGVYVSKYRWDDLRDLDAAVAAHQENPFYDFLRSRVVPKVQKSGAEFVKIVTTFCGQVIPAFTLAAMIKDACRGVHVNLGGICVAYYGNALAEWPRAARYAGSYSLFEHEYGFEHLTYLIAERLRKGQAVSGIPNVLVPGSVENRLGGAGGSACQEVTPDFTGLPLDRYFCNELILPLAISNGCHWHRCTFCLHPGNHRARSPESAVAMMSALAQEHGARHFYFADDSFSPEMLGGLADELLRTKSTFTWYCLARPEPALDRALCAKLARSGCGHLLLGIESASQRLLDLMDKGISIQEAAHVLNCLHEAGIPAMIFAFTGFPGETIGEAAATAAFLTSVRKKTSAISFQRFLLQSNTRVLRNAPSSGVRVQQLPPERAGYDIEWEMPGAVTRAEAEQTVQSFWTQFRNEAPQRQTVLQSITAYTGPFLLLTREIKSLDRPGGATCSDAADALMIEPSVAIRKLDEGTAVVYHGKTDRLLNVSAGLVSLLERFAESGGTVAILEHAGARRESVQKNLRKLCELGILVPRGGSSVAN
jgi:anaerobic magnesium-protoporphyrin IX monomethyl ester cyclase